MPTRIQLRRTKGWRKPEGAIVVSRPTKWGNPWRVDSSTPPSVAVARFRSAVEQGYGNRNVPLPSEIRAELRGHDLACWCPLDQPCHADVLLELANQ